MLMIVIFIVNKL